MMFDFENAGVIQLGLRPNGSTKKFQAGGGQRLFSNGAECDTEEGVHSGVRLLILFLCLSCYPS